MDEPPALTSKFDLSFLAKDVRAEFLRLFENCVITRGFGMEQRMDHGRALMAMRAFLKQYAERELDSHMDAVCELLEETPGEARRRISLSVTWDAIRSHLDDNGLSVRMPELESHVAALFPLDIEQRGPAWVHFWERATEDRKYITGQNIITWVKNYKALPMHVIEQIETVPDLEFAEDVPEEAKAVEDISEEDQQMVEEQQQENVKEEYFKHPVKVKEAIERIAEACAGGDPQKVIEWRARLSDPIKIRFEDIIEWGNESRADINKIGSLIAGDMGKGLHQAMRIVRVLRGQIHENTSIAVLRTCCLANGGRWEYSDGPYRFVVTYDKNKDYT